jgi:hypothetical protein
MVPAILLAAAIALGDGSPVADALTGPDASFLVLGALVGPCVLALGLAWRRLALRPRTAKLFHDQRYPCSLASELPAMPCNAGAGRDH